MDVRNWIIRSGDIHFGLWICKWYVCPCEFYTPMLSAHFLDRYYIDVITLDILRGFQGIGAAATIPASVRHCFFMICYLRLKSRLEFSLASSPMRSPSPVLGLWRLLLSPLAVPWEMHLDWQ